MLTNVFFAILILSVLAFMVGRFQARRFAEAGPSQKLHSRPVYHGAFVAIWVGIPASILVMLWLLFQGTVIDNLIMASLPETLTRDASATQLDLYLAEIKNVASGIIFGEPQPAIAAAAERYQRWQSIAGWAMVVVALCLMIITLFVAQARLSLRFRARQGFERGITILMVTCSVIAIMTTVGIIASLLFEAWFFFSLVPATEFLFGMNWEPQIAIRADQVAGAGAFGAVPVFVGTLLIATIAMSVATPIGLFSAIYLAEFASDRLRRTVKPLMEILAGIPTVVYGFFAILVVAPALRDAGSA